METISIKEKINSSLELNSAATEFLEEVDKINDNNIIIDFEGVNFVSRSFAQSYFSKKNSMSKHIDEININGEVKMLMDVVRDKFE